MVGEQEQVEGRAQVWQSRGRRQVCGPVSPSLGGARSGYHPLRPGAGPFSPESVPIRSGQGRIRSFLLPFTSGRRAWTWSELCWP